MKKIVFIGLFFLTVNVFAQSPKDIRFYLNDINISKTAKAYYNGQFKVDDGRKTFSILDSLNTRNNDTRPFYLFLVSKMMNEADGALSEGLGNSIKEYFETRPDNVLDFLFSNSKIVTTQFKNNWANVIAGEFMIICEDNEKVCIKKSLQQTLLKVKPENKVHSIQFYKLIESYFR